MSFHCLICGRPSTATHMGMEACRACTVFYRRNRKIDDFLVCITGVGTCMYIKNCIFACRRCRLDRYEAVMRAGVEPLPFITSSSSVNIVSIDFDIKMNEIINTPSHASRDSIIERIRINLGELSAYRCAEELNLLGYHSHAIQANDDDYPLTPGTYQFMDEGMKILVSGLFDFTTAICPEIGMLSHSDKWLLIRNYAQLFHCTDAQMRASRIFGKNSPVVFTTYTTVTSSDSACTFFCDGHNERIANEAAKTLFDWLEEHIPIVHKEFERVDPTDDEFHAIIGLALWNIETLDASDKLLTLAARYRAEIMAELTEKYRRTIGFEQATIRVGMLICMLQEFKRIVMTLQSNHALYRIIGAVGDNSLTIQLPVM